MKVGEIVIHTDGGSRGNPGPAASAFVVEEGEKTIGQGSKYLGTATNNTAEYQGVLIAVEWIIRNISALHTKIFIFKLDSELVVRQFNGVYKIKNEDLKTLSEQINKIIRDNNLDIVFKNVPRSENKDADRLVNEELDKQFSVK